MKGLHETEADALLKNEVRRVAEGIRKRLGIPVCIGWD